MKDGFVKCLVTGGAGFIGSALCDFLLSKSFQVICLDDLSTGSEKNIAHLFNNKSFHFVKYDITQPLPVILLKRLTDLSFIYHLASPASPVQYRKLAIETLLVNSLGTYNMLELAKSYKSVFLLASTSEVYGDPLQHPQRESYYGNVNPIGVRACYDEGKRFAEAITSEYRRKFCLKTRITRIFNTYGPRMLANDGRVISNFITQALKGKNLTMYGDGSQTRSFCYITDLVEGLILAAEKSNLDGEVINLGNPNEQTIKKIGELIIKLTKSKAKLSPVKDLPEDDPVRRKPDITKARKLLSWQPKVSLTEGLLKTIAYFKKEFPRR